MTLKPSVPTTPNAYANSNSASPKLEPSFLSGPNCLNDRHAPRTLRLPTTRQLAETRVVDVQDQLEVVEVVAEEAAELTETELEDVKEKLAILEVRASHFSFFGAILIFG